MNKTDPMIGRLIGDKYEVVELLGEGGMARVYKALQKNLDRFVALKVIKEMYAENDDFVKRFIREAKAMAGINHTNVVRVYDYGEEGNLIYIVMEHLEGRSIDKYINEFGKLSVDDIIEMLAPIAAALQAIHDKNFVHRDIKSSNIFLSQDGRPVLMDFGIAFYSNKTIALDNIMGTAEYMSPEQAKGSKLDGRSDLYSFGVVIYECLTGKVPFVGNSITAVIQKVINEQPKFDLSLSKNVPKWLQNLVMTLLSKDPDNRIGAAREVNRILCDQSNVTSKTIRFTPARPRSGSRTVLIGLLSVALLSAVLLVWFFTSGGKAGYGGQSGQPITTPGPRSSQEQEFTKPVQTQTPKLTEADYQLNDTLFINIEGGSFEMGKSGTGDNSPIHTVRLSDFRMSRYEITNEQFCAFLNALGGNAEGLIRDRKVFLPKTSNQIQFAGRGWSVKDTYEKHPVYGVTWIGADLYCRTIGGRLPTEAEWEYAANGGANTGIDTEPIALGEQAWYGHNSMRITQVVGGKSHNSLGLFDTKGNVWEWCSDYYGSSYYRISPDLNPIGPKSGSTKVIRGGDCNSPSAILSTTYRSNSPMDSFSGDLVGFRVVKN